MHHPPPHPSTLPTYLQLLDAEITGSLGNIAISSLLVSSDSIVCFHKKNILSIQHPALALDSRLLSLGDYPVPTNLHPPPSAHVERADHADRCTAVQEGARQQTQGAFRTLSTSYLMGYGNPRRAPCTSCHSRRTLMDPIVTLALDAVVDHQTRGAGGAPKGDLGRPRGSEVASS